MKKLILLPWLFMTIGMISQDMPDAYRLYVEKHPQGPSLNKWDSIRLVNVPEKTLPGNLKNRTLPPIVDNSALPYLRPVFNQEGPSCGQAAMIGYNFTYEINCLRDLSSHDSSNQYPTHFTFNFMNGGNGWYGVSYFHSIEMLKATGCMTVPEYGGMHDDGRRWIDGYDVYHSGMHNRIKDFYSIHTGTTDGILALKNWLYDHMGDQAHGGVASFYANVPWNAKILNDTTPEGGKHVMTAWYPAATHAMTIIGYNDSIRYDYNGDGLYTNHIDLNGDGIIDARDWEIGGVKFINSHGIDAQDSGYCYMMYKCLAETFENGGVWNQAVHILYPYEEFSPLMTYKVTIKHDYREKVKVMAGVSSDTSDLIPRWIMDFPIINYQGGDHYMQGQDTAEYLKYLEFGLDISPLLTHVSPGNPAKFFLIVDENDPYGEGDGEIISFFLIDYTSGMVEVISDEVPLTLLNHNRTTAALVHTPVFDKVAVTTEVLPAFTTDDPYQFQLNATGGTPAYDWTFRHYYRMEQSQTSFPMIMDNQVLPDTSGDSLVAIPLGFEFPFFGKKYDTVYIHIDGHIQFDKTQLPWPYLFDYDLHLRSNRIITPMTHQNFTIFDDEDGAWYETDSISATFRWKLSWSPKPMSTEFNFAVKLWHDGKTEFIYGPATLDGLKWIGGISAGNMLDYFESPLYRSHAISPGHRVAFLPARFPQGLSLSDDGWLEAEMLDETYIYDLSVRVTDKNRVADVKDFQLSSGPLAWFTVHSQGDSLIHYGDSVILDLKLRNHGAQTLGELIMNISSHDDFIILQDSSVVIGDLLPGEEIIISGAFSFLVSVEVPDQHDLSLSAVLLSDSSSWQKALLFKAHAPDLRIRQVIVDDGDNNILDPGETADFLVTLQNMGTAGIHEVIGQLVSLNPELQVLGNPVQSYGTFTKGATISRSFTLYAEESIPCGFPAKLVFTTGSEPGLSFSDTLEIRIGKTPVLLIDLDPNTHSGPVIRDMLDDMNIINVYSTFIPEGIDQFQSLFISLGYHGSNHVLTWHEGRVLADYLDGGGYIYMEGKKTWKDDPQTPVHSRFNITPLNGVTLCDTLSGSENTFTHGIRLLNNAEFPFSFYYLDPISPAYAVLHNGLQGRPCAVAHDAGFFKTIGSLFELGTLGDLPPSTTSELLQRYLDFFGIYVNPTRIDEITREANDFSISIYPNPAKQIINVSLDLTANGKRLTANGKRQTANGQTSLIITDLFGRTLMQIQNVQSFPFPINVSSIPDGLHIIQLITTDGQSASAKFIKTSD
ncbi:MAG: T9SS type A sorting domain-containing protein [Bacteroidales bacterium]